MARWHQVKQALQVPFCLSPSLSLPPLELRAQDTPLKTSQPSTILKIYTRQIFKIQAF